jgi:hypothetical protein
VRRGRANTGREEKRMRCQGAVLAIVVLFIVAHIAGAKEPREETLI